MSFTLGIILLAMVFGQFCTKSWWAMLAIHGGLSPSPHHQGIIYDSNDGITVGVLPRNLVIGEDMTWNMNI